jgi:5'-nucleotidase
VEKRFDLVASGINPNANLGHDVTYSGTVTAAMEAVIWGIPGLAVSLDSPENHLGELDYGPAARVAGAVAEGVIRNGLPDGILLNINVPFLWDDEIKGVKVTRQGLRVYRDRLDRRLDPRGVPYYWIGGEFPTGVIEEGTDFGALAEGCVSVTPLHLDLTARRAAEEVRAWAEGLRIPGG